MTMTPKGARILALSLAAGVVLLLAGVVIGPLLWLHHRYDKTILDFSDQLSRHRRIAASKDAVEAKLSALKARQPRQSFLKSVVPTAAANELQDIARGAIEAAGARFVALQIPPHKDEGRYRQVLVNVQVTGSAPALRKLVHAIETSQPQLFIENLSVRQTVGAGYRPPPGVEPDIFIQFDLAGYAILEGK